jgi:hypothetical protein
MVISKRDTVAQVVAFLRFEGPARTTGSCLDVAGGWVLR